MVTERKKENAGLIFRSRVAEIVDCDGGRIVSMLIERNSIGTMWFLIIRKENIPVTFSFVSKLILLMTK